MINKIKSIFKKRTKNTEEHDEALASLEFWKAILETINKQTKAFIEWIKYESYKEKEIYKLEDEKGSIKLFKTKGDTLLIEWTEIKKKEWGLSIETYSKELSKQDAIKMARTVLKTFEEK